MSAPRDNLAAKVRQWIDHADADLLVANHTLSLGASCPHHAVAFHAQQAAEKYLKAILIAHEIDFPPTHNIRRLLEMCRGATQGLAKDLDEAEGLTFFAVGARYPEEDEPVDAEESRWAVTLAGRLGEAAKLILKRSGFLPPSS